MVRNQFTLLALLAAVVYVGIGAPGHLWAFGPPPTQLAFTVEPSNGIAGQTLSPVAVAVEDKFGNIVTTDNTTQVMLTLSKNTLNGTLTQTVVNGVATFNNLSINTAATGYTLSAAAVNAILTGATSTPFDISAGMGVPNKLAFMQEPTNTPAGAYVNPAVTVVVQDIGGNTVTTDNSTMVTVSMTLCGGPITLESATDSAGIATFPTLRLNTVATGDVLNATAPGLAGAPSTAFNVTANPDRVFFDGFDDPACTP